MCVYVSVKEREKQVAMGEKRSRLVLVLINERSIGMDSRRNFHKRDNFRRKIAKRSNNKHQQHQQQRQTTTVTATATTTTSTTQQQ